MRRTRAGVVTALLVAELVGCSPKVQVEAPSEPITINCGTDLNCSAANGLPVKDSRSATTAGYGKGSLSNCPMGAIGQPPGEPTAAALTRSG